MTKFYAKTRDEAYEEYKKYCKIANKEYKYYLERWSPITVIKEGKDGKLHEYMYEDHSKAFDDYTWFENFKYSFHFWFCVWPKDLYYKIRDLIYLLKNKQEYLNSWNIDEAVLKMLEYNLPRFKHNRNVLSPIFLDQVILDKHKDDKNFDLKAFHEKCIHGYNEDIENECIKRENIMIDNLIEDIKLYRYYCNPSEFRDSMKELDIEFDKKWRHTLPIMKGSYDEYDYDIPNKLSTKQWNRILNAFQKYERYLND